MVHFNLQGACAQAHGLHVTATYILTVILIPRLHATAKRSLARLKQVEITIEYSPAKGFKLRVSGKPHRRTPRTK
jgi:hypothetical protein